MWEHNSHVCAGIFQSLVVATAAPPLPHPAPPSEAEEVGSMCRQLEQCVGTCDLGQEEVGSSGSSDPACVAASCTPLQVR